MHSACRIHQIFGNGTVIYSAWTDDSSTTTEECPVEIRLEGYRTVRTMLRDGVVVVLKRRGESEGVMTPASSVNAPKAAVKAYGKGVEALRKGKWAEAQQYLESAVALYPDYAQAYSDLGEALEQQKKPMEAQEAYGKALALSPKYLKPYAQLARLAIAQSKPEEAIGIADRAIKLSPVEFPSIYYYRALAYRQLQRLQEAEDSIKQAIGFDVDHQLIRAPYLLGVILEDKGDRAGAIQAFDEYVHQSPKPSDANDVRAHIERLKTSAK